MGDMADSCVFCGIDGGNVGDGGRIPLMFKSSASDGSLKSSASDGSRKKTDDGKSEKSEKSEESEESEERKKSGGSSSSAAANTTTRVLSDSAVKELFGLASASV